MSLKSNITQVLGNLPAGTFKRSVIACPAIVDLSPWASEAEISASAAAHGSDIGTLRFVANLAKSFVPDAQTWESQISPFALLNAIIASSKLMFIAN